HFAVLAARASAAEVPRNKCHPPAHSHRRRYRCCHKTLLQHHHPRHHFHHHSRHLRLQHLSHQYRTHHPGHLHLPHRYPHGRSRAYQSRHRTDSRNHHSMKDAAVLVQNRPVNNHPNTDTAHKCRAAAG